MIINEIEKKELEKNVILISHQSKDEWLQLRTKGIGGSDVAALCGRNKFKNAKDVYESKMEFSEIPDNKKMYFGRILETPVVNYFSQRKNIITKTVPFLLRKKNMPFAQASLDGLITTPSFAIVECKTTGMPIDIGQIPDYYHLQLQWYFFVTGVEKGYFCVLRSKYLEEITEKFLCQEDFEKILWNYENKFFFEEVVRDENIINIISRIGQKFWIEHIEKKEPPTKDFAKQYIKELDFFMPKKKYKYNWNRK